MFAVRGASGPWQPSLSGVHTPSASEIRAALAQPSSLVEHSPIDARTHQHSPRELAHAPLPPPPFALQEPPRSRSNSKSSDHHRSTPVTPHETLLRHSEIGLPPIPMMPPGLPGHYHAGYMAGHLHQLMQMGMQRPEVQQMMSAHAHVLHAQQHLMTQPSPAQLPQATSSDAARSVSQAALAPQPPPAHQNSSHQTGPPQVNTPLTPQLPMPPTAALPSSQALVQHGPPDVPPPDMMHAIQVHTVTSLVAARVLACHLTTSFSNT